MKLTHPVIMQRVENGILGAALLLGYGFFGHSWWLFALLILTPDFSMLAYANGSSAGSRVYNALHSYAGPLVLTLLGEAVRIDSLIAIAMIWGAHIAVDRALGYGLKYSTHFRHNHLSWK